jgi:hypothetical protein
VLAVGGERTVPVPDPIASEYLVLALRLEQLVPGVVDAYFGPRDLKAQVDLEPRSQAQRLAEDAAGLRERVASAVPEADRARWLDRQLVALETLAERQEGRELPYVEEVRRCFDAAPTALPPDRYREAHRRLDATLPGEGPLPERLAEWQERFTIPVDRLAAVVEGVVPLLREAAAAVWPLPDGESLRVALVTGQPWTAYNWYDGGRRSRIDINTDLPSRAGELLDTLAHETYPGHHLEHSWKEARLVDEQARLESTVHLIDTPESYVSEGLAELGRRYSLSDETRARLLLEIYRAAGLRADAEDAERQLSISAALRLVRGAGGDAALRLHAAGQSVAEVRRFLEESALYPPERAAKSVEFISHPLWRTYAFSYAGGEALLERWCEAEGPEAAPGRFFRLLTEQLTPSGMAEEIA